jgi:lysyl-tRNA synthetase class II
MPGRKEMKGKIRPKPYIVWSKKEIDLDDPWQRKWYIQQVLKNGIAVDISQLDFDEVRELLPELELPEDVKKLWEKYFERVTPKK